MKKVVLVVDDEEPIRRVVCTFCRSLEGVECLEATSGSEAVKLFDKHKVDLVISDLNMPGETGLHVLAHVRAASRSIPVMIFSGSLVPGEEEKLRSAGADVVLAKPARSPKLVSMIRNLLQKGR